MAVVISLSPKLDPKTLEQVELRIPVGESVDDAIAAINKVIAYRGRFVALTDADGKKFSLRVDLIAGVEEE
jgi:hypothetical protein